MSAVDYVRYVYYDFVLGGEFDKAFSEGWISEAASYDMFKWALAESISQYGYAYNDSSDDLIKELIGNLKENRAIRFEGDEYTGLFNRLVVSAKDTWIKKFFETDPVSQRLAQLGDQATSVALERVAAELNWPASEEGHADLSSEIEAHEKSSDTDWGIPASDRVVSRADNSATFDEIDGTLADIRKTLAEDNHVGDVLGDDREIIDQELEVAQRVTELGRFRVSSLMGWLLKSLRYIAEKFVGTAISEASKHLWTLLQALL